jgi:hypothetical protein
MQRAEKVGSLEAGVAAGLAAGRTLIGAGIWLAPERALPLMGFRRSARRSESLTLARIAGTRDLVLGAWQAAALRDRAKLRQVSVAAAVADAGDALAFAFLGARGDERMLSALGLAAAVPATAAGAWLATRLRG